MMLYPLPSAWRMKVKQRQNHVSLLKNDLSHWERKQTNINEWAMNSLKKLVPKMKSFKTPCKWRATVGILQGRRQPSLPWACWRGRGGWWWRLLIKSQIRFLGLLSTTGNYLVTQEWKVNFLYDISESHRRSYGIHLGRSMISVLIKNQDVPSV